MKKQRVIPVPDKSTMFCNKCHMLLGRTKDNELRCRRCEKKYFIEPEKKKGVDLRW